MLNHEKVYQYYINYTAENGRQPTLQQIAKEFGWTNREYPRQMMEKLEKRGYVIAAPKNRKIYFPLIEKGRIK